MARRYEKAESQANQITGTELQMKTITGADARAMRIKMGLSQAEFWEPLAISQSGASRYESGRSIPRPVQVLYVIAYGTEKQAEAAVERLRNP